MLTNNPAIRKPDQSHPKYRPDIDGLRAVAILSVIGYHVSPGRMPGGFVGVDVFFVISGFLISSIILRGTESKKFRFQDFYARRIRRIFPALIVVLVAALIIGWRFVLPDDYLRLGKHIIAGSLFSSNFMLWSESGYFDTAASFKPLLHLWSLGIEEQFYLLWPIALVSIWKLPKQRIYIIVVLLLSSFACDCYLIKNSPVAAFYFPLTRFWELLIGALLAVALLRKDPIEAGSSKYLSSRSLKLFRALLSILGGALILIAVVFFNKSTTFPGWHALLPTIGAALMIIAGPEAWMNRNILANPVSVFIGVISYPLYLWHWPLISISNSVSIGGTGRMLLALLAVLLSWMTYFFLEKRVRFNFTKGNKVVLSLCLSSVVVIFLGLAVIKYKGFANRFPPDLLRAVTSADSMDFNEWRVGKCYLLTASDQKNNFSDSGSCVDKDYGTSGKESIFLWGDSIAASLSPGFYYYQKNHNISLAQFTSGNCPPFLDFDDLNNYYCRNNNDFIENKIKLVKPSTVVLSAYWIKFNRVTDINERLKKTIGFLRENGAKRVILIGPLPLWMPELPRQEFKYWLFKKKLLPAYINGAMTLETMQVEEGLYHLTNDLKIEYVSALKILCNKTGCMTILGNHVRNVVSFDTMHLTVPAAKFFVGNLFEIINRK